MPFNGSGTFIRVHNWQDDADNNIDIEPDRHDEEDDGLATGLSNCITKDGQSTVTANIPFGGRKITGYGTSSAPSARSDVPSVGQVQDGLFPWAVASGTADAITATYSPAITALVDGMQLRLRAGAANATTAPTFSPNGIAADVITKTGGNALVAGDISADQEAILVYNLANTRWELVTPGAVVSSFSSVTVTGSSAPTNGMYRPAANTVGLAVNSALGFKVGIASGTGSPSVNFLAAYNCGTGYYPSIQAEGTDSNIGWNFVSKGTGSIFFETNGTGGLGTIQAAVLDTASAANYPTLTGGATGSPATVTIGAAGASTDVDIAITPKGAGKVKVPSVNFGQNSLDYYETGSFNGAFTSATGSITINTSFRDCRYQRIGNRVFFSGQLVVSSVSSPTGQLTITGLPFVCGNVNGANSAISITAGTLASGATTSIVGYIVQNTSNINVYQFAAGALNAVAGNVTTGSFFIISGHYPIS